MWSRSSLSLCRNSRSGADIMATGVFGGIGGIGAGCSGGGGVGGVGGRGSAVTLWPRFAARLGAMIAFSTFAEPHIGHVTSPRLACLSKADEFANQLSKLWHWSQLSA